MREKPKWSFSSLVPTETIRRNCRNSWKSISPLRFESIACEKKKKKRTKVLGKVSGKKGENRRIRKDKGG